MPRAFLITNRRYHSEVDYDENHFSRDTSPERVVCTAEEPVYENDDSKGSQGPFKPASPRSPAHESRGPLCVEYEEESQDQPLGLTVPRTQSQEACAGSDLRSTVRRDLTSQLADCPSLSPCLIPPNPTTALVTVIRQLMQQTPGTPIPVLTANLSPSSPTPSGSGLLSTSDSHVCPECGKRYSTSSNLARHRQTHRSVTDKKARKCPHCDKVYVSMPAYSMHVRTHSQGCQCPYCGKCFSRPWLLQGHIRTHTGEKPFTCPVCHKAFADKSNLRAHIQTHSSSKPYVCQRCGKAFALKSYLYKHEESSCMRLHRQQERLKDVLVPSENHDFSPLPVA